MPPSEAGNQLAIPFSNPAVAGRRCIRVSRKAGNIGRIDDVCGGCCPKGEPRGWDKCRRPGGQRVRFAMPDKDQERPSGFGTFARCAGSLDRVSIEYRDESGGQCPPYGVAVVGRALPAGPSASMRDVIKRQSCTREGRRDPERHSRPRSSPYRTYLDARHGGADGHASRSRSSDSRFKTTSTPSVADTAPPVRHRPAWRTRPAGASSPGRRSSRGPFAGW